MQTDWMVVLVRGKAGGEGRDCGGLGGWRVEWVDKVGGGWKRGRWGWAERGRRRG
jgi:hypothetical protein